MTAPRPDTLVDVARLAAGIRRRRRIWLGCAAAGLVLGVAATIALPAGMSASARILVVHEEETGDTSTQAETDIALFETTRVAGAALAELDEPATTPERLLAAYAVEAVAGGVLEVVAVGRDEAQALARTQALADAFVADHVRRTTEATDAEANALLDLRAGAERQLDDLENRIEASAVAGADVAQLEALYAGRSALSAQIQELGQRAEEASIGAPRVAAGTQIVDAPRRVSRSVLVSAALTAAIGLVLGLGIGLGLSVVGALTRDRATLRRDIAAELGASVIAQLPAPPSRLSPARYLGRTAGSTERRRTAATLARAVRTGSGGLSVLEIGCPRAAAALVIDMAEELATTGEVTVVDDLPRRDVLGTRPVPESITLVDGTGFSGEERPGVLLGIASVGPGAAWTDVRRLGAETLLVVRAGAAESAWLHGVARQLLDAEVLVVGIVVVHPDPRDRSDGTLWDGLHTALRGRAAAHAAAQDRLVLVPRAGSADGDGTSAGNGHGTGNGNGKNNGSHPAVDDTADDAAEVT